MIEWCVGVVGVEEWVMCGVRQCGAWGCGVAALTFCPHRCMRLAADLFSFCLPLSLFSADAIAAERG